MTEGRWSRTASRWTSAVHCKGRCRRGALVRAVTKEELLRAGWAKTHVTDDVLKIIIMEIRRAREDDPAAPRFIETVPRRGYRFITPRGRPASIPAAAEASAIGKPWRRAQEQIEASGFVMANGSTE